MRAYCWIFLLLMFFCSNCSTKSAIVVSNNPREQLVGYEKFKVVVSDEKGKSLNNILSNIIYASAEEYLNKRGFEVVNKNPDILVIFTPYSETRYAMLQQQNTGAAIGSIFTGVGQAFGGVGGGRNTDGYIQQQQQLAEQQQQYTELQASTPPEAVLVTIECVNFLIARPGTKKISSIKIAEGSICKAGKEADSIIFDNDETIKHAIKDLLNKTKVLQGAVGYHTVKK